MVDDASTAKAGWRMNVAIFALAASIFTVIWFAVAALGTNWGWWPWQVGLGQMTIGTGPIIALIALGLSIIAQVIALIKAPRMQPFILALAATLISAFCMFRLVGMGAQAASLPPLHDIQTDWANPIQFSESTMSAREAQGGTNPVLDAPVVPDYAAERWPGTPGRLVSELQEEAEAKDGAEGKVYPNLETYYYEQSPAELAEVAERMIERRGWTINFNGQTGRDDGQEIQIEATATSSWFGFKDDIAIRFRPVEQFTAMDVRSISRVGLSDLGANSKRVYGFMVELEDRVDGRAAP